jgi:hypothetical protein
MKTFQGENKVQALFYPVLPELQKAFFFMEGSQASPICPSGTASCR